MPHRLQALFTTHRACVNEFLNTYSALLWLQLQGHQASRPCEKDEELDTVAKLAKAAKARLDKVSSCNFDNLVDLTEVYVNVYKEIDLFDTDYGRLPCALKKIIQKIYLHDVDCAEKRISDMTCWVNVYTLHSYCKSFLICCPSENVSQYLSKYIEVEGLEGLKRLTNLRMYLEMLAKNVETCRMCSIGWQELGLPSLIKELQDLTMIILKTVSQAIIKDGIIQYGADMVVDAAHLQKHVSAVSIWAEYYKFFVDLFGYWSLPQEFRDITINKCCKTSIESFKSWLLGKNETGLVNYFDLRSARVLFDSLVCGLGEVPVVSWHLSIGLCESLTLISVHFENYFSTRLNEAIMRGNDKENVDFLISCLCRVGRFLLDKRNELVRSLDNCVVYKITPEFVYFVVGWCRESDVVKIHYPLLPIDDIVIFCPRKVSQDHAFLYRLWTAMLESNGKIDTNYIVTYMNDPNFRQWDGDVVVIDDPVRTPPILLERFNKASYYVIFDNHISSLESYQRFNVREFDDLIDRSPKPFDPHITSALNILDEQLARISINLLEVGSRLDGIGALSVSPKCGQDYFAVASLFFVAFSKTTRVQSYNDVRLKTIDFCNLWLRFLQTNNVSKWRQSFLRFIERGSRSVELSLDLLNKRELRAYFEQLKQESISGAVFERVKKASSDVVLELKDWDSPTIKPLKRKDKPLLNQISFHSSKYSEHKHKWQRLCTLGTGTFGTVFEVMNLETGKLFAMKEIYNKQYEDGTSVMSRMKSEFEMVCKLNHPNILKYHSLELSGDHVQLYMELCGAGTLTKFLTLGPVTNLYILRVYCRHILQGLEYLHSKRIIHRDLKPDNVLMNWQGILKLADFGSYLYLEPPKKSSQKKVLRCLGELVGTPAYMAPEVILGEATTDKADIWSFGCTIYHLVSGNRPWPDINSDWGIIYWLGKGDLSLCLKDSHLIDQWTMSIITKCLTRNYQERPSAKDLLNDPFFMNIY